MTGQGFRPAPLLPKNMVASPHKALPGPTAALTACHRAKPAPPMRNDAFAGASEVCCRSGGHGHRLPLIRWWWRSSEDIHRWHITMFAHVLLCPLALGNRDGFGPSAPQLQHRFPHDLILQRGCPSVLHMCSSFAVQVSKASLHLLQRFIQLFSNLLHTPELC